MNTSHSNKTWSDCSLAELVPRWDSDSCLVRIGDEAIVVGPYGWLVIGQIEVALAQDFDGSADIGAFVVDLEYAGVESESAEALVKNLCMSLSAVGAAHVSAPDGSDAAPLLLASSSSAGLGDEPSSFGTTTEPATEIDEDGTEWTTVSVSFTNADPENRDPFEVDRGEVESLLIDGRSPAEVVPADSCLGHKLRLSDYANYLGIELDDGRFHCLRATNTDLINEVERRAALNGLSTVRGRVGSVDVFVADPLEGQGPVRIYDRLGRRRGRPRTFEAQVDLVDQLFGELRSQKHSNSGDSQRLSMLLASSGEGMESSLALVPEDLGFESSFVRRLRSQGWWVSAGPALLNAERKLVVSRAFRPDEVWDSRSIAIALPGSGGLTPALKVRELIRGRGLPTGLRAEAVLDALWGLVRSAAHVDVDRYDDTMTYAPLGGAVGDGRTTNGR